MRDDRRLYIVCYDICDPKRLRKVYKVMRAFGDHLQYSVFRCVLDRRRRIELQAELEAIVSPSVDQVLMIPVGLAENPATWDCVTVGVPVDAPERVVRIVG